MLIITNYLYFVYEAREIWKYEFRKKVAAACKKHHARTRSYDMWERYSIMQISNIVENTRPGRV